MSCQQDRCCRYNPTIVPANNFDAAADARTLYWAMKGLGTDEDAIINVLCCRSILQRLEIAEVYKANYGRILMKELKKELSGYFLRLMSALMNPLPYLYARDLHDAAEGLGSDEETIIEILCTSNYGIRNICALYKNLYGKTIEFHLKNDRSGQFRRLCECICKANRDEKQDVDEEAARADAKALADIDDGNWDTENYILNNILLTRSYPQLQKIFTEYENIKGKDIEETIKKAFSGSVQRGLIAIVKCIKSKVGFLAERLHYSMKSFGTNDKTLIRIVVSRSEIDLGDIKKAFLEKYGDPLEQWIADDTSGDYKKALLTIVE